MAIERIASHLQRSLSGGTRPTLPAALLQMVEPCYGPFKSIEVILSTIPYYTLHLTNKFGFLCL